LYFTIAHLAAIVGVALMSLHTCLDEVLIGPTLAVALYGGFGELQDWVDVRHLQRVRFTAWVRLWCILISSDQRINMLRGFAEDALTSSVGQLSDELGAWGRETHQPMSGKAARSRSSHSKPCCKESAWQMAVVEELLSGFQSVLAKSEALVPQVCRLRLHQLVVIIITLTGY
jgi:hypothetical protein